MSAGHSPRRYFGRHHPYLGYLCLSVHLDTTPTIREFDDPDAEDDWASGSYGRMEVANSDGPASGFSIDANDSVDAGGGVPA